MKKAQQDQKDKEVFLCLVIERKALKNQNKSIDVEDEFGMANSGNGY